MLNQVEIITHTGPHRRLWMGPQFNFKTYQNYTTILQPSSPSLLSQSPESNITSTMDILTDQCDLESLTQVGFDVFVSGMMWQSVPLALS